MAKAYTTMSTPLSEPTSNLISRQSHVLTTACDNMRIAVPGLIQTMPHDLDFERFYIDGLGMS